MKTWLNFFGRLLRRGLPPRVDSQKRLLWNDHTWGHPSGPLCYCESSTIPIKGHHAERVPHYPTGDDELEVITAPLITSRVASSRHPTVASSALVMAEHARVVTPSPSSTLVVAKSSQRRAPLTPSGSSTFVSHAREGDMYIHIVNIGIDFSALHDFQVAWELSKILLFHQDVEE